MSVSGVNRRSFLRAALAASAAATLPACKPTSTGAPDDPSVTFRPGEPLPETGAFRMYVDDDEWQDRVAELMDRARLVVMLGRATTAGVHWEIERAVANVPPERLVFYFPPIGGERERWFEAFRASAERFFPKPLPPSLGNASFLAFGEDWSPEPIEGASANGVRARHESLLALMRRLEPGFVEPPLRELVPKPRLYLAYSVLGVTGFLATLLIGFGIFKFNEILSGV